MASDRFQTWSANIVYILHTAAMQPGHSSSSTARGSDWLGTVPTSGQVARAWILSLQTGMATGQTQFLCRSLARRHGSIIGGPLLSYSANSISTLN